MCLAVGRNSLMILIHLIPIDLIPTIQSMCACTIEHYCSFYCNYRLLATFVSLDLQALLYGMRILFVDNCSQKSYVSCEVSCEQLSQRESFHDYKSN